MRNNLVLIIHLLVGLVAVTSPFWLDWKIILFGIILFYIQHFFYGRCLLTVLQFKNRDVDFTHYCLSKLGLKIKRKSTYVFISYLVPPAILITALIFQGFLR